MENPRMNICSALLFINKMQIKTIKHCGTPVSMAKMVTKLLAVGSLDERSDHLIISFAAAGSLRVQSLREKKIHKHAFCTRSRNPAPGNSH